MTVLLKRAIGAIGLLAAMCSAQAQLQARDINHDGSIDAFYDVQQDLSWLADANLRATLGLVNVDRPTFLGSVSWGQAVSWAQSLNVHGVSGWRLPLGFLGTPACSHPDVPCEVSLMDSELARLDAQFSGSGPFLNLGATNAYWLGNTWTNVLSDGTPVQSHPGPFFVGAYGFNGAHYRTDELNTFALAWAVHDGDIGSIAAVPEPSTYAVMTLGLAFVGLVARRNKRPPKVSAKLAVA